LKTLVCPMILANDLSLSVYGYMMMEERKTYIYPET
jgi:hypothetical protein